MSKKTTYKIHTFAIFNGNKPLDQSHLRGIKQEPHFQALKISESA